MIPLILLVAGAFSGMAQEPPPDRGPGFPGKPPLERGMRGSPAGRWWSNPALAERLNLTDAQRRRIGEVFREYRIKLIDLSAALKKEEAILEDLLAADSRDQSKAFAQIDRVADARAELERVNGRMLWEFRNVLEPAQWQKLQERRPLREGGPRSGRRGNNRE